MSDSPKSGPGYTVVTIHDYLVELDKRFVEIDKRHESRYQELDRRFLDAFTAQKEAVAAALAAADRAVSAALAASDRAVTKAEVANEKRLDSVNEFRAQQKELIGTFIPRNETENNFRALADRIGKLETRESGRVGGEKQRETTSVFVMAIVGLVIALVTAAATVALVKH